MSSTTSPRCARERRRYLALRRRGSPRRHGVVVYWTAHRTHRHPARCGWAGVRRAAARRAVGIPARNGSVEPTLAALDTCRLAGFGDDVQIDDDLVEWDYGAYEGRRTVDIHAERPQWSLWDDGVPEGETAADVGTRADRADRALLRGADRDVVVFSHSHFLRVFAARWTGLPPDAGRAIGAGRRRVRRTRVGARATGDRALEPAPRLMGLGVSGHVGDRCCRSLLDLRVAICRRVGARLLQLSRWRGWNRPAGLVPRA